MNKAVIGSKSFLQSNKIEEKQRSSNLGGMRQGKVVAGKNKYFFFGTNWSRFFSQLYLKGSLSANNIFSNRKKLTL